MSFLVVRAVLVLACMCCSGCCTAVERHWVVDWLCAATHLVLDVLWAAHGQILRHLEPVAAVSGVSLQISKGQVIGMLLAGSCANAMKQPAAYGSFVAAAVGLTCCADHL
jgi:hypothetical protein